MIRKIETLGVALCLVCPLFAQVGERVFREESRLDSLRKGELSIELNSLSFFKDDEYAGGFQKGYSLPGFWLQPKLTYQPLKNLRLELGAHLLRYWGATTYPCYAYHDIAEWSGEQYQRGFHALPWFRAEAALSDRFRIVLGDIYGRVSHGLAEPLYNPELNLMADPEAGVQLLYVSRRFELDVWVDWRSFIFREDTHQESFVVGLSSEIKLNAETSPWHFYLPVQALAQHRGGEIDTIYTHSVQTLVNGAIGAGAVWNPRHSVVKRVEAEADATFSWQQAGDLWPFDMGAGFYLRTYADLRDFRVKAAYWMCRDFVSVLGSPFYGALSLSDEGRTFDSPQMVTLGAEWSRTLGHGFSIGADIDVYIHLKNATSFSAGVYLRVNPTFLLKKF
ncbi:hypothetical protein B5F77_10260 [Parabacteroides sp. An277]|uniref:hypothetical protein n=1 Tax=Parabacteroides sp. An277 TaxID=1965619 RepID=UPI000B3727D0|nr:hypothetical protein [Parabacteroides sp. An277]OUO51550.1 hypothetical protein B5F77_10260 [Parabacteroides sp. An277]